MKKILVVGASGAMGKYLVPELAALGFSVTGVSLDDVISTMDNVEYIKGNAFNKDFLRSLLANKYDGIVDFMSYYNMDVFPEYMELYLQNTDHYIFLSSCRVFDDKEVPVKETSPKLIDSSEDEELKASDDYCIIKAKQENYLINSKYNNWTIVRPATTYGTMRLQLVTLEFANTVARALQGKKVVLPIQAKDKPATFCWGGDVAKMMARLMLKEEAKRESYNVCSGESRTWGEIADYYKELVNLETVWVDKEDYLAILDPSFNKHIRWQLEYARMFHRISDNTKILNVTGLKQSELLPLKEGLKKEIGNIPADYKPSSNPIGERMDEYLKKNGF